MDIEFIKDCVKKITVKNHEIEDVEVVNESPLKLIGKGRQGAVFHISEDKCMKVYGDPDDCEREYYAMNLGKDLNIFPKIYEKGSNFIVMEFVTGIDLREYLQSQPLTMALSKKLIEMLIIFKEIGFDRIDHHKRQIYLQEDGSLKVIDVGRTVWRDRVYPYPRKLINSLGEEYKQTFLNHVQTLSPELYEEWLHYIKIERASSELTELLLKTKSDDKSKNVKKKARKLLTTKEVPIYEKSLEDLVFKVFKEEWIKVLIAQGLNPDEIKAEIKRLWPDENKKKEKKNKEQETNLKTKTTPPTYRYGKKKEEKIILVQQE